MKRVLVIAAAVVMGLSVVGCASHRVAANGTESASPAATDTSAYQSGAGAKFGGKLGHHAD